MALQRETVKVCPGPAVTPHVAKLSTSELLAETENGVQSELVVGVRVGAKEGVAVGWVGRAVGRAVGKPTSTVGPADGEGVGLALGRAVVGTNVGIDEGENEGMAEGARVGGTLGIADGAGVVALVGLKVGKTVGMTEGRKVGRKLGLGEGGDVGDMVGKNVTACTPRGPETTAFPAQDVASIHPRRTMYCCWFVPTGTVYCTCEHVPHAAGAAAPPDPVLSYTTSAPAAVKTRIVVCPVHEAPEYSELHVLTTNVCPDAATTPQVAKF